MWASGGHLRYEVASAVRALGALSQPTVHLLFARLAATAAARDGLPRGRACFLGNCCCLGHG